jgi:thiol-disulfide isomerase/thioredoxin
VAAADLADCPATDPAVPARDDGMPDLTLPCLGEGPDVRLAGLRGTPTVINLWASWCAPCRDEMPLFADLAATGKVRVLGISVQDDPGPSLSLLTDVDAHYASAQDYSGSTKAALRWVGLPMTIFVDADGVVTKVERGQITTAEQLEGMVSEALGVQVAS